jgi:hypothetical protein
MNWLNIAAELVRGAMNARQQRPPKPPEDTPKDVQELMDVIHRYRTEVNSGIEALAQTIQEQKERQLQAIQVQRRWNYGLLAGLVTLAVTVLVLASR